jgi:hypothetical protein
MNTTSNHVDKSRFNMAQLAGKLIAATTAALHGHRPRAQVRAFLTEAFAEEPLASCIAALVGAIDDYRGSAALLMASAEAVLIDATFVERASVFTGIADVASEVGDIATEIAARQEAILAQRHATYEVLTNLSTLLYKQAVLYAQLGDHSGVVTMMEEVLQLDAEVNHPDRELHQQAMARAQSQGNGVPENQLHDAISAWCEGSRDAESLISLLNTITGMVSETLYQGAEDECHALAQELARLRAASPLPVTGANDFLHVLQLWLRHEPGMEDKAAALRETLPAEFARRLERIET